MSYPQNQPGYGSPAPYGQQNYQQQGYGYQQPAYGGYGYGPPSSYQAGPRSNPVAGILLVLGGIAGLLVGLLPWTVNGDNIGVITAIDFFEAGDFGGTRVVMLGIAILAATIGGLLALIAGLILFGRGGRGAAIGLGWIGAILMVAAGVIALIVTEGQIFDGGEIPAIIMVFAGLPALIGAILAMTIK